jgi:protein gp37
VGTNISWATETWNPSIGCDKVSPGCDNCYAITQARIRAGNPNPKIRGAYQGVVDRGENGVDWTGKVNLLPDRLQQPFKWRKPRRVFVDSMSDLFHSDVPDGFIAQVWEVMAQTPQHIYQILTKRPGRMRSWVTRWHDNTGDDDVPAGPHGMPPMPRGPEAVRATYTSPRARLFADMLDSMGDPPEGAAYPLYDWMEGPRYYPGVLHNVHLGVSVEDQKRADQRVAALLETPAAVRFLSCEPLLGPVNLGGYLRHWVTCETCGASGSVPVPGEGAQCTQCCGGEHPTGPRAIDWVIVGGESGPGARRMDPEWARSLQRQCQDAVVAFHFKQTGSVLAREWGLVSKTGSDPGEWSEPFPQEYPATMTGAGQ